MKNLIILLLLTSSLLFSAVELKELNNARGDISVKYPKEWFVKEVQFATPYQLYISDSEIQEQSDRFFTGITIMKYFHQQHQIGLQNDFDESLEAMKAGMKQSISGYPGMSIEKEEVVEFNGIKYLRVDYQMKDSLGKLYFTNYNTVYNDVYLNVVLEADEKSYPKYKEYFSEFMKNARLFAKDRNDNELLDNESIDIFHKTTSMDMSDESSKETLDTIAMHIEMNPTNPFLYYGRGLFYIKLCQALTGKEQQDIAKICIGEFEKAADFFIKRSQTVIELESPGPMIANSYVCIGEIYKNVYNNKDKAKFYFELAYKYHRDPDIKSKIDKLD